MELCIMDTVINILLRDILPSLHKLRSTTGSLRPTVFNYQIFVVYIKRDFNSATVVIRIANISVAGVSAHTVFFFHHLCKLINRRVVILIELFYAEFAVLKATTTHNFIKQQLPPCMGADIFVTDLISRLTYEKGIIRIRCVLFWLIFTEKAHLQRLVIFIGIIKSGVRFFIELRLIIFSCIFG